MAACGSVCTVPGPVAESFVTVARFCALLGCTRCPNKPKWPQNRLFFFVFAPQLVLGHNWKNTILPLFSSFFDPSSIFKGFWEVQRVKMVQIGLGQHGLKTLFRAHPSGPGSCLVKKIDRFWIHFGEQVQPKTTETGAKQAPAGKNDIWWCVQAIQGVQTTTSGALHG